MKASRTPPTSAHDVLGAQRDAGVGERREQGQHLTGSDPGAGPHEDRHADQPDRGRDVGAGRDRLAQDVGGQHRHQHGRQVGDQEHGAQRGPLLSGHEEHPVDRQGEAEGDEHGA